MERQAPFKDTTELIWEYLYKIRVRWIDTTSTHYLKEIGMPSSGDKRIDQEQANQWIVTYQPIAKMVDLHRVGSPIKIIDPSDPKRIYEAVTEHLNAWKHQLTYGLNIGNAPIDDLIAMDRFANDIYPFAKDQMKPGEQDSPFIRYLRSVNPLSVGLSNIIQKNLVKPKDDDVVRINGDDGRPDRESLSDFLKQSLNTSTRFVR